MGEPSALRYLNEVAIPTIKDNGWMVQGHDEPGADMGGNITYTAGLTEAGIPELAIAGLPHDLAAVMLNDCARTHLHSEIRAGMTLHAPGGGALRVVDAPGVLGPVARALYGKRARFLQLLWPDPAGHYPGDEGWSQTGRPRQPVHATELPDDLLPPGDGVLGHYDEVTRRRDAH